MKKISPQHRLAKLCTLGLISILTLSTAKADNYYWNGIGNNWGDLTNWSTVITASTPNPLTPPDGDDLIHLHVTGITGPQTINLLATQSALGIRTNNANAFLTSILGGGSNQTLNLGTSGITHLFGGLSIGSNTEGQKVNISLQGSQTWQSSAAAPAAAAIMVRNEVSTGVAGSHTLTLNGSNTGSTIHGNISDGIGTLAIEKTSNGTWTLRGNNTFSGGITLTAGTLAITSTTALGTGPLTFNGGAINNTSNNALTHAGAFDKIINSNITYGTSGSTNNSNLTLGTVSQGTPIITFNNNSTITVNGSTRLTLSGHYINGGTNILTKAGTGSLTLGGTNTGANGTSATLGGVNVNEGTLTFIKSGLTPGDHLLGATSVAAGATLILATNNNSTIVNFTTSGLTGSGTITTATDQTTGVTQRTLRVGNNNANSTFAGTITNPTSEDGVIALTKLGTGTQVLSGNNTYTGATTVTAGTLQIGLAGAGSISGSTVTVNNANANLAGTGSIQGNTTISNGYLRPGDDSGSLTGTISMSQLALNTGGTAILQIEGTSSHDRINITDSNALTLDGKISVTTSLTTGSSEFDTTFAIGNSFNLIDWVGSLSGTFNVGDNLRSGSADNTSQFDLPDISSLMRVWDVSQFLNSGVISIAAVPEPSKALLLLLSTLALIHQRRR